MSESMVLCESAAHVLEARRRAPDAVVVAITPIAAWFCQHHHIGYQRLDDFCLDSELNELGEMTVRREYAWAKWLDETICKMVPDLAVAGFAPARAQLYFLKRTLDNLILPARILQELIANARPAKLIVFERQPFCPDFMVLPPERPLFAWLAPAVVGDRVQVETWPNPAEASGTGSADSGTRRLGRLFSPARARRLLNRITDAFGLAWSNMHANQARVAWCGNPDPMDLIVSDLLRRRVAVTRVSSRPGKRRQDTVERERIASLLAEKAGSLMATDAFWQVLDPVSPALRAFAEPFLKRWLLDQVPLAWVQFQNVRDWLRSGRFSALICTEIQDPVNSSILMAAEALALPRITCVHNPTNGVVDGPAIDCLGPIQSDVHLVAGEGEARYYRTFENRLDVFGRAKEIAVGSPRLDALRNSSERQSAARLRAAFTAGDSLPLILYIPTNLTGCYRYFNEGHISDVAYFELQQRMVKVFAEFPNVRLLYKPFRSEFATNPIPEFISEFVPNGRVVFTPLTELVWAVDAIIIDYPSTPLVEAALTDKPIIVYAGRNWARMPSEAKQALEKRAWVSEAPDEFESQGRQFLTAGNFVPLASPDDEFLRLYATHLNDGRSAERAADVILNIVAEQETLRSRTLN